MTEASFVNGSEKMILGTGPVTAHEVNEHITEESYNLFKTFEHLFVPPIITKKISVAINIIIGNL